MTHDALRYINILTYLRTYLLTYLLTVQSSFPSPYAGYVPNLRLSVNVRSSLRTLRSGMKLSTLLVSGHLAMFALAERTIVLDCGLVPNLRLSSECTVFPSEHSVPEWYRTFDLWLNVRSSFPFLSELATIIPPEPKNVGFPSHTRPLAPQNLYVYYNWC